MQSTWKLWQHSGNTLTFSPSTNSAKQIGQSIPGKGAPVRYTVAGSAFISIFLMPDLASSTPRTRDGPDAARHRLQHSLQRIAALTLNAHRMEQSNAPRMMTKLESKLTFATFVTSVDPSGLSVDGLLGDVGNNIFRYSSNILQWKDNGKDELQLYPTSKWAKAQCLKNHYVSSLGLGLQDCSTSQGNCCRRNKV